MSIPPSGFMPHLGKAPKAAPKFAGKSPVEAKKQEEAKKQALLAHHHAPAAKKPDHKAHQGKLNYHA